MSEPKRYGHKAIIYPKSDDDTYITIPVEQEDGQWVAYSDYARLKAEVERLTKERDKALTDFWYIHEGYFRLQAEVNRLTAFTTRTIIPNEELQAQVERLTKAGDALSADVLFVFGENKDVDAWNAAKEGKQP